MKTIRHYDLLLSKLPKSIAQDMAYNNMLRLLPQQKAILTEKELQELDHR
ncbi:hypothetical protein [Legionella israelensis]|nr:hypothetical protein [Legionella israelensis]